MIFELNKSNNFELYHRYMTWVYLGNVDGDTTLILRARLCLYNRCRSDKKNLFKKQEERRFHEGFLKTFFLQSGYNLIKSFSLYC